MDKTKIITMYLPQYHQIPENDKWWGKGFTDWVSVKSSESLFDGHRQPRVPVDEFYYDLTDEKTIRGQAELAKRNGIYGFGIYHYWFSSDLKVLYKPAEILLKSDIDMPFFLAWDNCSWIRTWSKYKHNTNAWSPKYDKNGILDENENGVLAKLEYGNKEDWKIHFDYLKQFFRDERYIKIDNKPIFIVWNYHEKETLAEMMKYWHELAKSVGFDGMYFMSRLNPYDSMKGFDSLFTYEPMYTAWQNRNIAKRVIDKISDHIVKEKKLTIYDYDQIWGDIIAHAKKTIDSKVMYGGFVSYDDTPRRGQAGKVITGESPDKFKKYVRELINISTEQRKPYVFLTAWNEWGEGAYLEPDTTYGMQFLEALSEALTDEANN